MSFISSSFVRWFCHLDDDNYLNVDNLLSVLSEYPPEQDHYLGRSSLNHAIETIDREDGMVSTIGVVRGGVLGKEVLGRGCWKRGVGEGGIEKEGVW